MRLFLLMREEESEPIRSQWLEKIIFFFLCSAAKDTEAFFVWESPGTA